ncbi:hypothetical protein FH972_023974 [Carpinus fangiana]|uniref:RRM domain-containing protein n=1 Tax=Carpinus fangiana TaxID=176857 RepID=A0A5N6KX37_9ROSI|nr:hypothetical protein FH972_023974 [Carpinus fangiana]
MAKVKSDKKVKPSTTPDIKSVKSGKVTKPAQSSKVQAKDIAKKSAATLANGSSKSKKSKKAPTPESDSEEDSDVSDDSDSSASDSEDSEDSESSDSSDSEAKAKPKANGVKVNGAVKANGASKDDSDSEDSSDDSSEAESEDEKPAPKAAAKPAKKAAAASKAAESSSEEGDSDDSSEGSDSSEDEAPAKTNGKAVKAAPAVNGAADSASDDSSEDDDDSASSEEEAPAPKKRKADAADEPATKKSKTEAPANENASLTLFVGNLSWNVDEEWLRQEFSELGNITGCRVLTDPNSGRSKGMGYVDFSTADEAAAALAAKKDQELDGRAMNVDFAQPRGERKDKFQDRASKFGDSESPPSDTLFVGNIPFESEDYDVKAAFEEHAAVVQIRLPKDRDTGAPKGFGYISFASVEDATTAKQAMTGFYMGSRPLRLDYAQPRDDSQGGGRGGGFGGGRGRGGDRGRGGFGGRGRGGDRGRGGFGGRGRGAPRGNFSSNRGGVGDFSGRKVSFD